MNAFLAGPASASRVSAADWRQCRNAVAVLEIAKKALKKAARLRTESIQPADDPADMKHEGA